MGYGRGVTSVNRTRWWAVGLLIAGLVAGGAVGALAGSATGEPESASTTTPSTTTTTVARFQVDFPTADPAPVELPVISREGEGPDPLLAVGLTNEEVIVRATQDGLELLPVDAPGWVMGLGYEGAAFYDGTWVYLAPLSGEPLQRWATETTPTSIGSEVVWLAPLGGGGAAVARVDLDTAPIEVQLDPPLAGPLPPAGATMEFADADGTVLSFDLDGPKALVATDRAGNLTEIPGVGPAIALTPDAVAGADDGGPVWFDRRTGELVDGPPPPRPGCEWPIQFQGTSSLWWCEDGLLADRPTDWSLLVDGVGAGILYDDGTTVVAVRPLGVIEILRPAEDGSIILSYEDALISAVRP